MPNLHAYYCFPFFLLLVPVRPDVFRPGLACPDISNRFGRDAVLGRELTGGARRLDALNFEYVDGLFRGQSSSVRHCLRLRVQALPQAQGASGSG